jgi:hypothetical protein
MNKFDLCRKDVFGKGMDFNKSYDWDLFLSGYNLSERIRYVYDTVRAREKIWLIAPDYVISQDELPSERYISSESRDEGEVVRALLNDVENLPDRRICVDSTGFVRQHLLFLIRLLFATGVKELDILYAEPEAYRQKEKTKFSDGALHDVRQVMGFEGEIKEGGQDLLIIGSGYDNRMISKVAESKSSCRIIQMLGFPPLRADMYQENMMKVSEAEDYTDRTEFIYAPANDPFVTACVIKETIARIERVKPIGNIYLSPLGTKAQVLGFALYYMAEMIDKSASIIYPVTEMYSKDTTVGVSRVWRYSVEFA